MEENEIKTIEDNDTAGLKKVVEPLPVLPRIWFSALAGVKWFILWLWGWVMSVLKALLGLVIAIGKFFYKGAIAVYKGAKELYHEFRFNDLSGRLSFVVFGSSSFAHKQYTNGALYLAFEIVYLVFFFRNGITSISYLGNLGSGAFITECIDDELLGQICSNKPVDNSILILIFGILWIFSIFFFGYIWRRSIKSGYSNYRICHFGEFSDRIEKCRKASIEIAEDMEENNLYEYKNKELYDHYSPVYELLDAQFTDDKMGLEYAHYVLNETITNEKENNSKLLALKKKKAKAEAKRDALISSESYKSRLSTALSKMRESDAEAEEATTNYNNARDASLRSNETTKENDAKLHELEKKKRWAKNTAILADDHYATISLNHEKAVAKKVSIIDGVSNLIQDEMKSALPFVTIDDANNHSRYGKFNNFYKKEEAFAHSISFYSNYALLRKEYERGLTEFDAANTKNKEDKVAVLDKYRKEAARVKADYDATDERRNKAIDAKKAETVSYRTAYAAAKSNGSSEEELKEMRFAHIDRLKTLQGIIEAIPTAKETKTGRKEEMGNATHAYKRDTKALKEDYTGESYAAYLVQNFLIVKCAFSYKEACGKVKEVAANLPEATVSAKIEALQNGKKDYEEKYPTKFEGKPKTFKAQVGSLFDENFHITLLALPVLGIIVFTVMPLVFSILIAFTNYSLGHQPPTQLFGWIGLGNFQTLFNPGADSTYATLGVGLMSTIEWTIVWAIVATFSNYFLGIIFALMINKKGIKLKKFWRFIFVLSIAVPQFISLIGISTVLKDTGALGTWWVQTFGTKLGFASSKENDALVSKIIIILVNIWIGIPYTILSTTGILMNIPKDLYESSTIDGAGTATQFFKITMPYIFFVTGPQLITTFIGNINNFGVIYFLTGGGPDRNATLQLGYTDLLITFLYKMVTSANNPQFGLASAIGILVFVICAFFSLIVYNRSDSVTKEDQFQ